MKAKRKKRGPWRRKLLVIVLQDNYLYGEIEEVADRIMQIFKRRRK